MNVEYIRPFALATVRVLEAELGVKASRGELSIHRGNFTTQEVTVLIGITGDVEGSVLFGTDRATVNRMVTAMIGEEHEVFDETSQSAIAELSNVISGHALMVFEEDGIHCTITPPNVLIGEGIQLSSPGIPRLIIPFNTEMGSVEVAVSLRKGNTRAHVAHADERHTGER